MKLRNYEFGMKLQLYLDYRDYRDETRYSTSSWRLDLHSAPLTLQWQQYHNSYPIPESTIPLILLLKLTTPIDSLPGLKLSLEQELEKKPGAQL